ncbi:DNA-binding response regulator [Flavobacterium magnum]|uniref:DNA-binding response regulator n=1 Tax=Flavobacterium magnum TaxID=2162713 RepID=A0A2S0RE64_9FLAO|nr:LytTR family DNA-binding domain-containing protein [Flavobacterium magnum]AWA29914.1 DNA-binding response regulator [Flavobacterium magnum]
MPQMPIYAVVVTEDPEGIGLLRKFEEENAVILNIAAEAANVTEGISAIASRRPDLIFLDGSVDVAAFFMQLDKQGFAVPKVIMMSAEAHDAVEAFRHNAVDFIMKPLEFNLLMMSMYKVIRRIEMERAMQKQNVEKVSAEAKNEAKGFVAVSSLDKIELLRMSDILFCKSEGKYTVFHLADGRKIMSSRNLGEYSKILDYNFFFRVHHSYVVNLLHIRQIVKKDGYFCEFANGITVPVATRRQEEFQRFMKL